MGYHRSDKKSAITNDAPECMICYEALHGPKRRNHILACKHDQFCLACLKRWLDDLETEDDPHCPVCRKKALSKRRQTINRVLFKTSFALKRMFIGVPEAAPPSAKFSTKLITY